MKRIRILGLAVVASLAVAGVLSASALAAAPEFNPGSGTLTIKSGTGKLEVKGATFGITCKTDKGTGSITGAKKSTFSVDFEGCTTLGGLVKCNTKADAAGVILVPGSAFLTTSGTTTVLLFLTTAEKVEVECAGVIITILGKTVGAKNNGLVCPVTPIAKKVKTTEHYTVTCATTSKGVNTLTTAVGEGGTSATYILEAKEGSGSYEQASEQTTEEVSDSVESEIT
jgi:hypothetical protein